MSQQDAYRGVAESDTERKPESTPSLNKQPPSGSKKYGSKSGEVGFIIFTMILD